MRTTTWSNIGTDVSTCKSVSKVMEEAHLDYTVEKQPIMLPDGTTIAGKCATVKQGTNEVFGVVSEKYEICQNIDAFEFVDSVPNVEFVKAGQTDYGMVYIIGKLPDVTVLDDTFTPYLIFQNGHNGLYSLKTTVTPLRIVCQNQFNYSFKESPNTISIMHSKQQGVRLAEAARLVKGASNYMQNFKNTAEELAMLKLSSNKVQDIINSFYKIADDASNRAIINAETARTELFNAYMAEDNANFTGTAWGLINGFSDYLTHKPSKATDDHRFMTVTFEPRMFMQFVNHVRTVAA